MLPPSEWCSVFFPWHWTILEKSFGMIRAPAISGSFAENRIVNYEVELDVDRDHTEQEVVIRTTLYEPRDKSCYRVEGTERMHSDTNTSRKLGPHSIFTHGRVGLHGQMGLESHLFYHKLMVLPRLNVASDLLLATTMSYHWGDPSALHIAGRHTTSNSSALDELRAPCQHSAHHPSTIGQRRGLLRGATRTLHAGRVIQRHHPRQPGFLPTSATYFYSLHRNWRAGGRSTSRFSDTSPSFISSR